MIVASASGTLVAGILGLAAYNYRKLDVGRDTLVPALTWAAITGIFVALVPRASLRSEA